MNVEEHIDKLIGIAEDIKINRISILTGDNGSGKSLIRKLLPARIGEQLNKDPDFYHETVASTSQELRTGSNPEWGALGGIMRDVAWTPTSTETLKHIKQLIEVKDRFIVIDEPEIGMGEETVAAMVNFLNNMFMLMKNHGVCIITHNRYVVENINADDFYNIQGLSKKEWLEREIIPTDLNQLEEDSLTLMRGVQDRINKTKEKKSNA